MLRFRFSQLSLLIVVVSLMRLCVRAEPSQPTKRFEVDCASPDWKGLRGAPYSRNDEKAGKSDPGKFVQQDLIHFIEPPPKLPNTALVLFEACGRDLVAALHFAREEPRATVLDVMVFDPKMGPGEEPAYECAVRGLYDPQRFGWARRAQGPGYHPPETAFVWSFDPKTAQFVKESTQGVQCTSRLRQEQWDFYNRLWLAPKDSNEAMWRESVKQALSPHGLSAISFNGTFFSPGESNSRISVTDVDTEQGPLFLFTTNDNGKVQLLNNNFEEEGRCLYCWLTEVLWRDMDGDGHLDAVLYGSAYEAPSWTRIYLSRPAQLNQSLRRFVLAWEGEGMAALIQASKGSPLLIVGPPPQVGMDEGDPDPCAVMRVPKNLQRPKLKTVEFMMSSPASLPRGSDGENFRFGTRLFAFLPRAERAVEGEKYLPGYVEFQRARVEWWLKHFGSLQWENTEYGLPGRSQECRKQLELSRSLWDGFK